MLQNEFKMSGKNLQNRNGIADGCNFIEFGNEGIDARITNVCEIGFPGKERALSTGIYNSGFNLEGLYRSDICYTIK
jgi:hypothetical protein